ncbi:hypothetical protein VNI00_011797 [Paramarasmius palmivorus]|uniref:Pentatricopeptide repeat-containing protein-mitochondrial domain-containing protein n=1 Tax=Paramarasmius palmivorus TaxID=297713 RepID=A0AAW0CAJ1_9AGAR
MHRIPLRRLSVQCRRYATASERASSGQPTSTLPPTLRAQPWSSKPDTQFQRSRNRTSLASWNMQLANAADREDPTRCFEILEEMKKNNVKPDINTYHSVFRTLKGAIAGDDAVAIFDDMVTFGVQPDVQSFNYLIEPDFDAAELTVRVQANHHRGTSVIWKILDRMKDMSIEPNASTYASIIRYFTGSTGQLETALRLLQEMQEKGLEPDVRTIQRVIELATEQGFPRLGVDLAEKFQSSSLRTLDSAIWLNCLRASAAALWREGVIKSWEIVVQELQLNPDEGICIGVLNTAARTGSPDLATDALRVLKASNVPWQEYHFAPLVEAFCRAGQLKEAFIALEIMQSNNVNVLPSTSSPIVDLIKKDEDTFDATWSIVDEIHKGKPLHISVLNIMLRAANALGDLQRAVGAYKSASEYNLKPDLETFNLLLEGSVGVSHRPIGDLVLADMKKASIAPDQTTYELMIKLCLTQGTYEDAFFYLEEEKGAGYTPSQSIYTALVEKCASNSDARYRLAMEEMKEMKYEPSFGWLSDVRKSFLEAEDVFDRKRCMTRDQN